MEERKTVIDYIEQVMKIFGFSIIMLNIFCILFGESAKEFSTIFALGKEGLRVDAGCVDYILQILVFYGYHYQEHEDGVENHLYDRRDFGGYDDLYHGVSVVSER